MSSYYHYNETDTIMRRKLAELRSNPRLSRTSRQGVAEKPVYWSGARWSEWMRANCPAWRYNGAQRLWFGPLTDLGKLAAKFPAALKSDGVIKFLEEQNNESND